MILLLGGASETAPLCAALVESGRQVLVSTATDAPLALPSHPLVERRSGRLDATAMAGLLRSAGAKALVDATHPYAAEAQANACAAARAAGVPYLRWQRSDTDASLTGEVVWAGNHEEAARAAFAYGRTVLLMTGSRNLEPYARQARSTGLPLYARVLPLAESLAACRAAGLTEAAVIAARGPFSVDQNQEAIRATGAGVIVSKDGGAEGGVPAKLEAARLEGCRVVVVRRPSPIVAAPVRSIKELLDALRALEHPR